MQTAEIAVSGMDCDGCEGTLKRALGLVEGVQKASADHASGRVVVTFDPARADVSRIHQAILDAGYEVAG